MESALKNYRSAAEKTFNFTKPNNSFRDESNDAIGILLIFYIYLLKFLIEIKNLRITAPLKIVPAALNEISKVKQLSWTEVTLYMRLFYIIKYIIDCNLS